MQLGFAVIFHSVHANTLHVQKCTTLRPQHHSALTIMNTSFISKSLLKLLFEVRSWESGSIVTACNIIFVSFEKRNRDILCHVNNFLLNQI